MRRWGIGCACIGLVLCAWGCTKHDEKVASTKIDVAAKQTASDIEKAAAKTSKTVDNVSVTTGIKKDILLSNQIDSATSKIDVDTTNQRIKLMGHVGNARAANAAISLAKKRAGGRKVLSQLKIGHP